MQAYKEYLNIFQTDQFAIIYMEKKNNTSITLSQYDIHTSYRYILAIADYNRLHA